MVGKVEETERFLFDGKVDIPHKYSAGKVGSRFLIEMRDNEKIFGMRCPTCKLVYVPPRSTCKYCFEQLSEWVELSDKGTLLTYAVAHQATPIQPVKPPITYGIVQLDGADTGFVHILGEVEPTQLKVGMRMKAVFKDKKERAASILDIKYFKPLK